LYPAGACRDWLSTGFEADIEQLEVNSCTPLRQQYGAAAAASGSTGQQWQQQVQRPTSDSSGGGWAPQWDCEQGQYAPLMPAQGQRAVHVQPGLLLVASSPAGGLPAPSPAAAAQRYLPQYAEQQRPQQQQHTLFDLAGMEMNDLLGA
jgi:hypothetical protein